jgi:hypothetical protein
VEGASSDTTMLEKWLSDALVREQREEWATPPA